MPLSSTLNREHCHGLSRKRTAQVALIGTTRRVRPFEQRHMLHAMTPNHREDSFLPKAPTGADTRGRNLRDGG